MKELEIYCIYTRLKFDEIENDIEAISWNKLKEDLMNTNSKKINMDSKKYKVLSKSIANKKEYKSVTQSQTLKKVEDNKKSKEKDDLHLNQSRLSEDLENYLSISDFTSEILKYIGNNASFSFKSLLSKDDISRYENKEVVSYYKFHNILIEKKIISKKILLEDFSRFLIITKDSEDIVVDLAEIDKYIQDSIAKKNNKVEDKPNNKIINNEKNKNDTTKNKVDKVDKDKIESESSYKIEHDDEKYEFNEIDNDENFDENMFNEVS